MAAPMTLVDVAKTILYGEITNDLRHWAINTIWESGFRSGNEAPRTADLRVADPKLGEWAQQHPELMLSLPEILQLKNVYDGADGNSMNIISAIKELRQMKGWSLRESKDKIDELFRGGPMASPVPRTMA